MNIGVVAAYWRSIERAVDDDHMPSVGCFEMARTRRLICLSGTSRALVPQADLAKPSTTANLHHFNDVSVARGDDGTFERVANAGTGPVNWIRLPFQFLGAALLWRFARKPATQLAELG